MLQFKKEVSVDSKDYQVDMEDDIDGEDMGDFKLDNERGRHWRMFFEENDGRVDDNKSLLHAKRWDV